MVMCIQYSFPIEVIRFNISFKTLSKAKYIKTS